MLRFFINSTLILASVLSQAAIDIDAANATTQILSSQSIRLNNLKVTGFGLYQVDLVWDNVRLVFVPTGISASQQNRFVFSINPVTSASGSFSQDLNVTCLREAGAGYRVADWVDLTAYINGDSDKLKSLTTILGWSDFNVTSPITGATTYYISYKSKLLETDGTPFFAYFQKNGGSAISSGSTNYREGILANTLMVSNAFSGNTFTKRILCINPSLP